MATTLRQVYEGVLVELNKVQAPSMLLEDFNYFANKAINQYINKKYSAYDVNQQSTDDLRVLKSTTVLTVEPTNKYGNSNNVTDASSLYGATYEAYLPMDYLHLLNCICNYKVKKRFKCYEPNTYVQFGATRLSADLWGLIINNFYMKPSYKKPYYYLHNVNVDATVWDDDKEAYGVKIDEMPTNPYNHSLNTGTFTDWSGKEKTFYQGTDIPQGDYEYSCSPEGLTDVYIPVKETAEYDNTKEYYKKGENDTYSVDSDVTADNWETKRNTLYIKTQKDLDIYIRHLKGDSNLPRTTLLRNSSEPVSLVEIPTGQRLANTSLVRIEIRTGKIFKFIK